MLQALAVVGSLRLLTVWISVPWSFRADVQTGDLRNRSAGAGAGVD